MALSRSQSKFLVAGVFAVFVIAVAFFIRSDEGFKELPQAQKEELSKEFAAPKTTAPSSDTTGDTAGVSGSTGTAGLPGLPGALGTAGTAPLPEGSALGGSQFVLGQFHRSEVKDGKKLWEVTAQRGEYHPQSNTAELEQAVVSMYKEDKPLTIRASKAVLSLQGNSLLKAEASGEVMASSENHGTLTTTQATFDKVANTLTTEAPVTITTSQLTIRGTGLFADLNTKEFTLKSEVDSVLLPKSMLATPAPAAPGSSAQEQPKQQP